MKLLLDNAISPKVAPALREHGHDVVHVREIGLQAAKDEVILARALAEDRSLFSSDADFGTILALRAQAKPLSCFFVGRRPASPKPKPARFSLLAPWLRGTWRKGPWLWLKRTEYA